jgi:hypothetical protein
MAGGCGAKPAPVPAAPPAPPAFKSVPITGRQSAVPWNTPFSADRPTFPASEPLGEPLRPLQIPNIRGNDQTLVELAEHLRQTGKPEVPQGVQAALVGVLPGERYIYHLGGYPQHGVYEIYQFRREGDGWVTSPICMDTPWPVWPGPDRVGPIFLCGLQEGSGAVLSLAAYRDDEEVLRITGVEDGWFALAEDPAGGPPAITVSEGTWWLDHKLEPRVVQRYTFAWQNGEYVLARHERRDDWVYHLARFLTLIGEGNYDKAAGEFAAPPAGGVKAYLEQHAPHLIGRNEKGWTTAGHTQPPDDVYLTDAKAGGPRFHFRFDAEQRLSGVEED